MPYAHQFAKIKCDRCAEAHARIDDTRDAAEKANQQKKDKGNRDADADIMTVIGLFEKRHELLHTSVPTYTK